MDKRRRIFEGMFDSSMKTGLKAGEVIDHLTLVEKSNDSKKRYVLY